MKTQENLISSSMPPQGISEETGIKPTSHSVSLELLCHSPSFMLCLISTTQFFSFIGQCKCPTSIFHASFIYSWLKQAKDKIRINQSQIQILNHKNQIGLTWIRSPSLIQLAIVRGLLGPRGGCGLKMPITELYADQSGLVVLTGYIDC